jgi:hypothetical protein
LNGSLQEVETAYFFATLPQSKHKTAAIERMKEVHEKKPN